MAKYVKLGDKAESFFDPFSRLSLAGKDVKQLTGKAISSNRVRVSLLGGHLSHASEAEFIEVGGKVEKESIIETIESKFGTTAEELLAYYKDNFEVKAADIRNFKKLSLQEMVDELIKLGE